MFEFKIKFVIYLTYSTLKHITADKSETDKNDGSGRKNDQTLERKTEVKANRAETTLHKNRK